MSWRDKIAKAILGIRAYHGSPHSFDKFDSRFIGTGEGNQTFGRGLYFAENEGVAKGYRDALSNPQLFVGGQKVGEVGALRDNPVANAAHLLSRFGGDVDAARADVARSIAASQAGGYGYSRRTGADILKAMDDMAGAKVETRPGGHMYEVNIKADPKAFLNYDQPIGQQSPLIQSVFDSFGYKPRDAPPFMLNDAANQLAAKEGSWETAAGGHNVSEKLREAGVPGIRYLDQGSRDVGKGTSNYTVFDPGIVDITRKYGLAAGVPLGAGAMGGTIDQSSYGERQ
jgi:hypothetical protein